MVVYFSTATNRRLRGVLWSIIAPPFIEILVNLKNLKYLPKGACYGWQMEISVLPSLR